VTIQLDKNEAKDLVLGLRPKSGRGVLDFWGGYKTTLGERNKGPQLRKDIGGKKKVKKRTDDSRR